MGEVSVGVRQVGLWRGGLGQVMCMCGRLG